MYMKTTLKRLLPCLFLLLIARAAMCEPLLCRTFECFSPNIELFRLVNSHHAPWLDSAMRPFAPLYWVLPVIALVFLTLKGNRRAFLVAVIAVAIESVIAHVLKITLVTPRPGACLTDVHLLINRLYGSFPSGDVALCTAIAFSMIKWRPRWVFWALCAYTLFVAYERMYVGVHFPLDVVAGGVIGAASGYVASRFWAHRRSCEGTTCPESPEAASPHAAP
jgi:membrane-associated phospholipid phosphatase